MKSDLHCSWIYHDPSRTTSGLTPVSVDNTEKAELHPFHDDGDKIDHSHGGRGEELRSAIVRITKCISSMAGTYHR